MYLFFAKFSENCMKNYNFTPSEAHSNKSANVWANQTQHREIPVELFL